MGTYVEDGGSIPLDITIGQSKDTDDSELLEVEITLPLYFDESQDRFVPIGIITVAANATTTQITVNGEPTGLFLITVGSVTLSPQVNELGEATGVYDITSTNTTATDQKNDLNEFLDLLELDPAVNYAGEANIKVAVSSIEQELDDLEVAKRFETVTDQIAIKIGPIADPLKVVRFKAEANGLEGEQFLFFVGLQCSNLCRQYVISVSFSSNFPIKQTPPFPLTWSFRSQMKMVVKITVSCLILPHSRLAQHS